MPAKSAVSVYAEKINKKDSANTTEFSFRTEMEELLNETAATLNQDCGELTVLHEPSRQPGIGAPDFLITNKSGAAVGYVECKKPGTNLKPLMNDKQLQKYSTLSNNILLTDYRQFYLLREGQAVNSTSFSGIPTATAKQQISELVTEFMSAKAQSVGTAKQLAEMLAVRCALLRNALEKKLPQDKSQLSYLLKDFKKAIYRDITEVQFADALAQTMVYGLLMAKINTTNHPPPHKLDLWNVERYIPENFALMRQIAGFLKNLNSTHYASIQYLIDNVLAVINAMDATAIAESMSYKNTVLTDDADPYLYLYETFLAKYDPNMREALGVYYTPPLVVKFIVRAADDILRRDFGKNEGLADKNVTALDFAAGTGTFLLEMIRLVFNGKQPAKRDLIAHEHLLKNFFGFELLIAPYAIAHMKLSQFLSDMGVKFRESERINVYLTNTLERNPGQLDMGYIPALAEEADRAQEIKDREILVVTGNPPYSMVSHNTGDWITDMIGDYKMVDGKPLGDRNTPALQDDYVKFIRFAQWKISKTGQGIVAIITNHAFMENPTCRGMRQSILNTFDRLYFLDLHGNALRGRTTPDGGADQNVFDIQQGVAISLLVKKPGLSKGVFHADCLGLRPDKLLYCAEQSIASIKWQEITPASPFYPFTPYDNIGEKKYREFYSLIDIFSSSNSGIKTHRDKFAYGFTEDTILTRIRDMADAQISDDDFRERYDIKDTESWLLSEKRKAIRYFVKKGFYINIQLCLFHPFDWRWCWHGHETMDRPRLDIMSHMQAGNNLALISVRQVAEEHFNHVMVTDKIADLRATLSNRGGAHIFPLYCDNTDMGQTTRSENLKPGFRKWINSRYGKEHTPEDILGCIYAVMHSPDYRNRYAEFLRLDFPRIPFPEKNAEFERLAKIGNALIDAHLLRGNCAGETELCGSGTGHEVGRISHNAKERRLYFNASEYFHPAPPEVYSFEMCGYKPLEKFLKSRKGRDISGDISTLENTVNAIAFTIVKMREIDD